MKKLNLIDLNKKSRRKFKELKVINNHLRTYGVDDKGYIYFIDYDTLTGYTISQGYLTKRDKNYIEKILEKKI